MTARRDLSSRRVNARMDLSDSMDTAPLSGSQTTGASTVQDLPDDVLTQILRRLDLPALAAASSATSRLRTVSFEIWRDLCLSTWPSLHDPLLLRLISSSFSYSSFFSDAYFFPLPRKDQRRLPARRLISAVDLCHKGAPVVSRAVETVTPSKRYRTLRFQRSPFRIDAFDPTDPAPLADASISLRDLTVSWVVIDPVGRRAVNLSSSRQVSKHWDMSKEEAKIQFWSVAGEGCRLEAVVRYGREGKVGEVVGASLEVGVVFLECMMNGERSGRRFVEAEAKMLKRTKQRYEEGWRIFGRVVEVSSRSTKGRRKRERRERSGADCDDEDAFMAMCSTAKVLLSS